MRKIKTAIAGLGRLGKVHGKNLSSRIQGSELIAACSIIDDELDYAAKELGVKYTYRDFREMVKNQEIEAVAIVTTSKEHCWQIEAALEAGKHVFSEKPLGVDLEQCLKAEKAVEKHEDKAFMLGFMRRFDPSYSYAKEKIDEGAIGQPYMVKAASIDPEALVEGAIKFSKTSGGIFLDMAIHDIDLMRWFLKQEPEEVYALGCTFKHREFTPNDDETAAALYKFQNGAIGMVHVGRTAPHGYHVETEIIGTEGSIRISAVPQKNLAQVFTSRGASVECVGSFPERFGQAYLLEMEYFIDCVLNGKKPSVTVYDGTLSTKAAYSATEAWKTGKPVKIS